MIFSAHVCGRHPEPRLAAGYPAAGELPRGRQDQEPNPRQPVPLACRAHRATPRRAARRPTAARRIALDTVLPRRAPQRRGPLAHGLDPLGDLALALIVARLPEPAAKPAPVAMPD